MNTATKTKVVIVGGGFAGIAIAKNLQKRALDIDITIVSKTSIFEYYPALYRLVTGALPIEVSVPLTTIFPSGVNLVEATYKSVDQAEQTITVAGAEGEYSIAYDYLVLALGSETNYFNIAGLSEHSYSFKSVHAALRLKQHFCDVVAKCVTAPRDEATILLHTIVVGGGPSGVELAGDLKQYLVHLCTELHVDPSLVTVDLVEASPRVISTFPPAASAAADARLRKMGINIFTNRALQQQEFAETILKDMDMKAATVVWTAGTRINSAYTTSITGATFDARKRIEVTPTLNLPGDERVFIAGDGAGTQYSGLAQTAIHNGAYIARSIIEKIKGKTPDAYKPHQPTFVIPIGDNWALLSHKNILITGFIPWIIRNAIDFVYFTSIVPLSYVFAVFIQGRKYRKVHGGCVVTYIPDEK